MVEIRQLELLQRHREAVTLLAPGALVPKPKRPLSDREVDILVHRQDLDRLDPHHGVYARLRVAARAGGLSPFAQAERMGLLPLIEALPPARRPTRPILSPAARPRFAFHPPRTFSRASPTPARRSAATAARCRCGS